MGPAKKKKKTKIKTDISKIRTLDSFFVDEPVHKDEFGFLIALGSEVVEGFFAAFDIDNSVKATAIYTKEILEEMVIPDVLKVYPNATYKIYPESEFKRVVKNS